MNKASSSAVASPPTSPRRTNITNGTTTATMATLKAQPSTQLERLPAPSPESSALRQVQCRAHAYVRLMERLLGHALPGLFKWIFLILLLGPAMATTVAARLAAFGFASPGKQESIAVEELDSTSRADEQTQRETTRLDQIQAHQAERTQLLTALQQNAKAAETSSRALVEKELAVVALQQALASARDVAEGQEATLRGALAQLEDEHARDVKEMNAKHAEVTEKLQKDLVSLQEEHAQALSTMQSEHTRLEQALQEMTGIKEKAQSLEAERESLKHANATLQDEYTSTKQQLQDALTFKDKAAAAEAKILSLQETHEALQAEIKEEHARALSTIQDECTRLEQALQEMSGIKEKAQSLEAERESLKHGNATLQDEFTSTKQQLQDALTFKDKATAAEAKAQSLQDNHKALQAEMSQLKQQVQETAEIKEKTAILEAQHQSLIQAHDALQKEKLELSQRYSQTDEQLAANRTNIKQLSDDLHQLSTKLTKKNQAHEYLQQRLKTMDGDYQAQLSKAETLTHQVRDVQARHASEKQAHAEQLTRFDTLQKLADERQAALQAAAEKQKATEAELVRLTADLNASQRMLEDAQKKIAEFEKQVQTFKTEMAQKQATIEKQEKELEAFEATKKELAQVNASLESQAIAFKKSKLDAEQMQKEVQKLQVDLGQAQEKTRSLNAEHEDASQKGNKLEHLVSELKSKLTKHQALETQHSQLQQEHATVKEALGTTKQQTGDLQRQVQQAQESAVVAQKQVETLHAEAEQRIQKERQELGKAHEHAETLAAQLKEAEVKLAKAQEEMHSTLDKANTEKVTLEKQLATIREEATSREARTASGQKALQEQLAHLRERASAHESAEEERVQVEEELGATKQQLIKTRAQMDNLRAQLAKAIEMKQVKAAVQRSASTSISDATAVEPALAPSADLEAAARPLSNGSGLGHARQSSIPRFSGQGGTPPSTRGSGSIPGSPSMSSRSRPGSSRYEQVVDTYVDIHKLKRSHDAEKQELLQQIDKLQASAPQDAATSQMAASGASERSASTLDKNKSKPGMLKRSSTLKNLFGKDKKK